MQVGIALQLAIVGAGLGAILATSTVGVHRAEVARRRVSLLARGEAVACPGGAGALGETRDGGSAGALFAQGFLVNATNPKATVFFLAVLPQFIEPRRPLLPQYLTVVATLTAVDLVVMSGYTLFAAKFLRAAARAAADPVRQPALRRPLRRRRGAPRDVQARGVARRRSVSIWSILV